MNLDGVPIESPPTAAERTEVRDVDRRARALVMWIVVWLGLAGGFSKLAGLKYAEVSAWPTDLYSFQHGPDSPVDVAILGSSKVSFGVPADLMATCVDRAGATRSPRVVNLGRMFATAWSAWRVTRDLLVEQPPRMLIIGLEPEFLDDNNPRLVEVVPTAAELEDLPDLAPLALRWSGLVALARAGTRGAEHLSAYTFGATIDARLRWLMLGHGGGQWCYSAACQEPTRERWRLDYPMWSSRLKSEIPNMGTERFGASSLGDGVSGRALDDLLVWAEGAGVTVVATRTPTHRRFFEQIPAAVEAAYQARVADLQRRGLRIWEPDQADYADEREYFVDPEHLNPPGARIFATELCSKLVRPVWAKLDGGPPGD